ncbi:MAG: CgeB family protein [Candidatus Helarchaeota archaeon]
MKLLYITTGKINYESDKNMYETLNEEFDLDIIYFNYLNIFNKYGKNAMNKLLLKKCKETSPDIALFFLYKNEFSFEMLDKIKNSKIISLGWFSDDLWRFDNYTKYLAPHFNYCLTTSSRVLKKYKKISQDQVILTQWGANPKYYRKLNLRKNIDISFIGTNYGNRKKIINSLKTAQINIRVFGKDWNKSPTNFLIDRIKYFISNKFHIHLRKNLNKTNYRIEANILTFDNMIRIINKSRLNLNLSTSSDLKTKQIKGRIFEITMCGGFLITEYLPEIEKYFKIDKEIVCYNSIEDLIEKTHYYLENPNLREKIALNGYKRSQKEHTYKKRFEKIFKIID